MSVWRSTGTVFLMAILVAPLALGQVSDIEVDTAGPLNDTGALPDCKPFPGLLGGDVDLSTGPAGHALAKACRATEPAGVRHLVTGHSVFVAHIAQPDAEVRFLLRPEPFGPPEPSLDFPPIVTPLLPIEHGPPPADEIRMFECVGWFNGNNVDVRPVVDAHGRYGRHFSDADQAADRPRSHDLAGQDHDLDRIRPECIPKLEGAADDGSAVGVPTDFAVLAGAAWAPNGTAWGTYAAVVERGDCAPSQGSDFRFRAHLDFVDPNGVYHEVQEYDYVCPSGGPKNALPAEAQALAPLLPAPEDDADPLEDTERCDPVRMVDPDDTSSDQRRCRGTVQDMMRERLWITRVHYPTYDPTTKAIYTFALSVDTCAAVNVHDGVASRAAGQQLTPVDQSLDPGGYTPDRNPHPAYPLLRALAEGLEESRGPKGSGAPGPLDDACVDGSSFSFDDTERGRTYHSGAPPGPGHLETMDSNAYDFDLDSDTFGSHRTNCRHNWIDWPYNTFGPGVAEDCYPEDHRTAEPDVYVYEADPTGGLFIPNSNSLTGNSTYHGTGFPSGPNCDRPDEPPCPFTP